MIFNGCAYGTQPTKAGIVLKEGYYYDDTVIRDKKTVYISNEAGVRPEIQTLPIAIQSDEMLLNKLIRLGILILRI